MTSTLANHRTTGNQHLIPAVFLDRDGVINQLVPDHRTGTYESPYSPGDVSLEAGAAAAIALLNDAELPVIVVSNQPAAAKGFVTLEELAAVHDKIDQLLRLGGAKIDLYRYCHHHPDGVVAELSGPCDCRKPESGLITTAATELGLDLTHSWMVGDSDTDIEAGRSTGCRTVLVRAPASAHRRSGSALAEFEVNNLQQAVQDIIVRTVQTT